MFNTCYKIIIVVKYPFKSARETSGFQYIRVQNILSYGSRLHITTNLWKITTYLVQFQKKYAQLSEKTIENSRHTTDMRIPDVLY